MPHDLNEVEVRVLGALIEKELSTPDYYPLTLNALTNACNQKSNREPVVSYDEVTVQEALNSLLKKRLVGDVSGAHLRAAKYRHNASLVWELDRRHLVVLAELLLRGPQTAGELRTRSGRMYEFTDLNEVQEVLNALAEREELLMMKLPRQAGYKEPRYAHLLSGEPDIEMMATGERPSGGPERMQALEVEVASLREELEALKQQFEDFKAQFQ